MNGDEFSVGYKRVCLRCKGTGQYIKINWFFGVLTLGMTAMLDASNPITCEMCDGTGYVRVP